MTLSAKLKLIAFENADVLQENHPKMYLDVVQRLCVRNEENVLRQIVVTARTWKNDLKKFFKIAPNPLLLIGNYMEAALYADMQIEIPFYSSECKMDKMKGINFNFWLFRINE